MGALDQGQYESNMSVCRHGIVTQTHPIHNTIKMWAYIYLVCTCTWPEAPFESVHVYVYTMVFKNAKFDENLLSSEYSSLVIVYT